MISDLSPGDRLSLKGKLFELQKKLNIIDIERKMEEQCSFQPKILEYDLPNRKKDFIENSDKADIMRKQKKKMLEQSLALQSEESCTFTPKIYKSRHAVNLDNRPVHVRLSEKAKVYNDAMEKRKVQFSTYDDDGNRLFVPRINSQKPAYLSKNVDDSVVSQPSSNIGADEFLYQDAKDREVRHQSRIISYQQEIAKDVNAHKMNSSSEKMLRKKMEKYATEIFLAMDDNHDNIIDYNNVVNYIEHCEISKNSEEQANNNQLFWSIIDQYQGGEVMKRDFIVICTAFLLNKTVHTISQLIKKYEHKKPDNPYRSPDNDHHHSIAPHIQQLKEKDITKFREILTSIIQKLHHGEKFDQSILQSSFLHPTGYAGSVINNEPSEDGGDSFNGDSSSNLFKPKISSYSYKLAEKKEKKDMQLLAELMPTLKYGHDAAINRSKSSVSVDMSQLTLEDLDTSHAGPLPEGGEDPELQRSPLGKTTTGHSPMNKSSSMMSTSGLTISGNSFTSKHERLLAQALLIQKRKEKLAEEVRKKENAECTFRPDRKTKNYQPGIKNLPNATNNLEQEQHEEEEGKEEEGDDDNDVAEVDQRLRENYEVDGVEEEHQEEIINEDIAEGRIELDLREGEEEGEKEVSDLSGELFENEQQQAIEQIDLTNDLTESNEKQPLQIKKQTSFAPTKPTQSLADNKTNDTNEKKKVKKAKNQNKEAESTTNNTNNNDNTDSNNNNPSEPSIYERLYSLKDKKPKAFTEIQPSYVQELQSCTFQPKIPKHHTDLTLIKKKMQNIHQSGIEKNYIEGFNKTVNRMRKTIQEKERIKQEESDEYLHKIAEEKYMKSRELARQGFQPFQFHLEERIHKQQQQQQQQRQNQSNDPNEEHRPDLIVDVKLSSNRSARIRVQHGDDPAELAIRFAKIYSLDKDATTVLETVLKESMIQRGILPDPRKAAANRSNSLSRTRQGSFGSGSEDRSSSNGHRRHRRRRHMSRRFSSRDSRDSIMLSGEEMADAIDDAIMNDGEYSRQPSHRPHRIDTEHSELLGDTSVIVVDEEYSSYTESSEEESESEFSEYEPPNQQALDATTSYLQKHGSHKTSYRDRTSILSELL